MKIKPKQLKQTLILQRNYNQMTYTVKPQQIHLSNTPKPTIKQ